MITRDIVTLPTCTSLYRTASLSEQHIQFNGPIYALLFRPMVSNISPTIPPDYVQLPVTGHRVKERSLLREDDHR